MCRRIEATEEARTAIKEIARLLAEKGYRVYPTLPWYGRDEGDLTLIHCDHPNDFLVLRLTPSGRVSLRPHKDPDLPLACAWIFPFLKRALEKRTLPPLRLTHRPLPWMKRDGTHTTWRDFVSVGDQEIHETLGHQIRLKTDEELAAIQPALC